MNSENLYDAITEVNDDLIAEAKNHKFTNRRGTITRWCTVAASLVLVAGISSFAYFNLLPIGCGGSTAPGSGGGGRTTTSNDGSTIFMSYAGPVFPLSILEDDDGSTNGITNGITAARDITFDFSKTLRSNYYDSTISVSDIYTLTNTTDTDKTINVLYPFPASFALLTNLLPTISIDGSILETDLIAGPYSGGFTGAGRPDDGAHNLRYLTSWEEYVSLLSDGEYLKRALSEQKKMEQTVIVYEFYNARANFDNAENPTVVASFNLDYDKTTILSYGFHGASFDHEKGHMRQSFSVPREWWPTYNHGRFLIIVVGDDISDLTVEGYKTGGWNRRDRVDDVTADVKRYEAVLGEIVEQLLEAHIGMGYAFGEETVETLETLHASIKFEDMKALLFRAVFELLGDYGVLSDNVIPRYQTGWLEELFSEASGMSRVFYLKTEISIPAGEGIELIIDLPKPGSFDFYGTGSGNLGISGYGMMTKLGSNLTFTGQTATLAGADLIEIVNQNFGFDPANNILNVPLDMNIPHYFIEVRGASS